jgi:hypothetical protein
VTLDNLCDFAERCDDLGDPEVMRQGVVVIFSRTDQAWLIDKVGTRARQLQP